MANLLFRAGQSNADEATPGSTVAKMLELGISDPEYQEAIKPGTPFRAWYTSGGAKELTTGVDTAPKTISSASTTSTSFTIVTSAPNIYGAKQWLAIENAEVSAYNGLWKIQADLSSTQSRISADNMVAFTGTADVREAGWEEVLAQKMAEPEMSLWAFAWMQGEGNAKSATINEMSVFGDYLDYIAAHLLSEYGSTAPIVVGLPSYRPVWKYQDNSPSEADDILEMMGRMRGKLIAACEARSNCFYVETSDIDRGTSDPVHISSSNYDIFNDRVIRAARDRKNILPPTRFSD